MLKVEFHCHTRASLDSLVRPKDLLETCIRRGIDRVVITDHNIISGALAARDLDPQRVIVGEEILTEKGELLAAYVKEEVPRGLPALEAIERLKDQGAFISVSHPFDRLRAKAWERSELEKIITLIDAIEIFNSRSFVPGFNQEADEFATKHSLAGTVGSDAHLLAELGRAVMLLPDFEDANGLRRAMADVQYETRSSGLIARVASRYAAISKRWQKMGK